MTPAEVLDAAADYIEEHGWWDGTDEKPCETACAVGAICRVEGGTFFDSGAILAMKKWLGVKSLAYWNDGQHAELVCKSLRACAADLRASA